jgi:hypothetical protein
MDFAEALSTIRGPRLSGVMDLRSIQKFMTTAWRRPAYKMCAICCDSAIVRLFSNNSKYVRDHAIDHLAGFDWNVCDGYKGCRCQCRKRPPS